VDEVTFRDRHGVDVFVRRWPTANAVGIVVLSHGASEHSGRYDRFARALNDAGIAAYAIDHRGHGRTADATGKGRMGPPGGDALVDDLDQVVDLALEDRPDLPVTLFGHSLGSLIALTYLTRHSDRLEGAVLCGFPASVHDIVALGDVFAAVPDETMRDAPVDALSAFNEPFEPARTAFDWLSRDEAEVDRYLADPLCGDDMPLTHGFVAELFAIVVPAVEPRALAAITCPVFVIAGDRDPSAAMGENAKLLEAALGDAGVTVERRLYPGARHELLNETNRDEVTADVIAWLRARSTPGSSLPGQETAG
jgi:alpha-beta hydrolase superfamily lysophospholipase